MTPLPVLDLKRLTVSIVTTVITAFIVGVAGSYIGSVRANENFRSDIKNLIEIQKQQGEMIREIDRVKVDKELFSTVKTNIESDIADIKQGIRDINTHLERINKLR